MYQMMILDVALQEEWLINLTTTLDVALQEEW